MTKEDQKRPKMTKNDQNDQKWPKMTKNDQKWPKMTKNDQKWPKNDQNMTDSGISTRKIQFLNVFSRFSKNTWPKNNEISVLGQFSMLKKCYENSIEFEIFGFLRN